MRRRKSSDLDAILFILFIVPLGVGYLLYWIFLGLWRLAQMCFAPNRRQNKALTDFTDFSKVDLMDGTDFEYWVANLLRRNGFSRTEVTKASGDFGVDIVAYKDKKKWAFQCKRYQGNLGVGAVQEVYSGARKYSAEVAVVITNSHFTAPAREMARDLEVLLWDRNVLSNMMRTPGQMPLRRAPALPPALPKASINASQQAQLLPQQPTAIRRPPPVPQPRPAIHQHAQTYPQRIIAHPQSVPAPLRPVPASTPIPATPAPPKTVPHSAPPVSAEIERRNDDMATVIGAGKYVFGEDVPMGKYDLRVISGKGNLEIFHSRDEDDYDWIQLGTEEDRVNHYHGLSLKSGRYFTLDGNLQVEITKTKTLEIE